MTIPYPVLTVDAAFAETEEPLGSKRKFWFRHTDAERVRHPWLYKYARPESGEAWAEKIAAEVAAALGIPHATVELAVCTEEHGSVSPSFVPNGFDLVHGNEILAGYTSNYDRHQRFRQSDHTFRRIVTACTAVFDGEERNQALHTLASYVLLDALVGNTDRHHENWALLRAPAALGGAMRRVAPSFDHASSLGRELNDARRADIMSRPDGMAVYLNRGRGGIFWDAGDRHGMNPLALAEKAATLHPSYFAATLERLVKLPAGTLAEIVGKVPASWMSNVARDFALTMLRCAAERLRRLSSPVLP